MNRAGGPGHYLKNRCLPLLLMLAAYLLLLATALPGEAQAAVLTVPAPLLVPSATQTTWLLIWRYSKTIAAP